MTKTAMQRRFVTCFHDVAIHKNVVSRTLHSTIYQHSFVVVSYNLHVGLETENVRFES